MMRDGRQGVSGGGFGAFFPEKFVSGEGEIEFEVSGRGSKTEIARQFRQLADKCDPPDTSSDGESDQSAEAKIDVQYRLPAATDEAEVSGPKYEPNPWEKVLLPDSLQRRGWSGRKVSSATLEDKVRLKNDALHLVFETPGETHHDALSAAVRIALALQRQFDRTNPSAIQPATENETDVTANDVLDAVTRQLTAAGFVGCDLPASECACECTCEIDLEGLGESLGNEVAAYYNALKAGGVTQDEAQYLAGDLHDRLWNIALGDED